VSGGTFFIFISILVFTVTICDLCPVSIEDKCYI